MPLKQNVRFKELTSGQAVLFPQSLDERIAANHPVRIVNQVVDRVNIDKLLSTYKGGGTSSFHPRMMLKVLFYSYFNNIYSCRKIALSLEENIHFMWLSGNNTPDFRTINEFRSNRLKDQIQALFVEVVKLMNELGFVSLDTQFIDGTKLESVAGRYTFVWRKSVENNKEKLEQKIRVVLGQIRQHIEKDQAEASEPDLPPTIDKQTLNQKIDEINQRLSDTDKEGKKKVKELEKHRSKLGEYEQHLGQLGDRNSYSKTDPDATFMRMKEDHMGNGQLKPGYNLQISCENQIVTCYSIHQQTNDTGTLKPHLEKFKLAYETQSEVVVADAGYGSEENYSYLENEHIQAYVKYNQFYQEQKRNHKKDPFHVDNLFYHAQGDYFICPMGQRMNRVANQFRKSKRGFVSQVTIYQAIRCEGCPLRGLCHKAGTDRRIEINHSLNRLKSKARELLHSPKGIELRKRRSVEPESVFGQLKCNNRFNRLKIRSIPKIEIDLGLAIIGHNLRKWARIVSKPKNKTTLAGLSLQIKAPTALQNWLEDQITSINAFFSLKIKFKPQV